MQDDEASRPPISADRWRRLEPLVDAALDLSPGERSALIAQTRRSDPALGDELQQFVAECEQSGSWLEQAAGDRFGYLIDEHAPFELPPVIAGRFRVERELGRGGMAVVFLAHDEKHHRRVAVKVMRPSPSAASSTSGAQRFLAEIRLTAGLRHPNIVPLYDSGESDGYVFFVMPFVDGESLRARMDREGALPVADAVRLARDVAAALEYAHARGVVHRDVKPSNVLLSGAETLLADFGIARAETPGVFAITETGLTIGTPAYMSPEQIAGDQPVGAASDIYSLGCVLYEMLGGEAPVPAATRVALARHGNDPVVPLSKLRPSLPRSVIRCVDRAMARAPGDRYASAAAFADALSSSDGAIAQAPPVTRALVTRRRVAAAAAVAVLGVAAMLMRDKIDARSPAAANIAPALDTAAWVLMPFEYRPGVTARFDDPDPLRDALRRWSGVRVVDRVETEEALATRGGAALRGAAARQVAVRLSAGRYVLRDVVAQSGDLLVHAAVYDAQTGRVVSDSTVRLVGSSQNIDSAFALLADHLLFPTVSRSLRAGPYVGTQSRPALQTFSNAQAAIQEWDLPRADAQLEAATGLDPRFARAQLWLAQVRVWRELPPPTWQFAVNAAAAGRDRFSLHDQRVAAALEALTRRDSSRACALWMQLAEREPKDFGGWYGSALCQIRDLVVIRDPRSPSRWRFRASYHNAMKSLRRAFELLPATHRDFRATWYWSLGRLLNTMPTQMRSGRAQSPDSGAFAAYASWSSSGDSLEFIPYRFGDIQRGRPQPLSASRQTALHHQRVLFRDIATSWRTGFRESSDAMVALGIALDQLGDRTALDSLRLARSLATNEAERLRAGAAEVWLRVKLGVPDDTGSLRVARDLADSLVRAIRSPQNAEAEALASLAVLAGHVNRAAALARNAVNSDRDAAGAVRGPAQALNVFAAVGGPSDSLRVLEQAVAAAIRGTGTPATQPGVRMRWLNRAATLAFPSYRSPFLREFAESNDLLAIPEVALLDGDTAKVRRHLAALRDQRRSLLPEYMKLEGAYPEAWLLDAIGDRQAALEFIGTTLDAQDRTNLEVLSTTVGMGALLRAMAFRADVAQRAGDPVTAKRWALAVTTLWRDADPFLQPLVKRMAVLAR